MRRHNYKSRLCWRIPTSHNGKNENHPKPNDLQTSFTGHFFVWDPEVGAGVRAVVGDGNGDGVE